MHTSKLYIVNTLQHMSKSSSHKLMGMKENIDKFVLH